VPNQEGFYPDEEALKEAGDRGEVAERLVTGATVDIAFLPAERSLELELRHDEREPYRTSVKYS
jgi:hypothetical protein